MNLSFVSGYNYYSVRIVKQQLFSFTQIPSFLFLLVMVGEWVRRRT